MYKKRFCRVLGLFVAILILSMVLSGCVPSVPTPSPTWQLLDFIPTELDGFPDAPLSASFESTDPLDEIQIPGEYAGREWITDSEIAVAIVMDFISYSDAAQRLAETKTSDALDINLGDEGYKYEELLANGSPGFRVILWQRNQFLIVVGGGILVLNGNIPSDQTLMNLAIAIDQNILDSGLSLGGELGLPPEEKSLTLLLESSHISSPLVLSTRNPKEITLPLIRADYTEEEIKEDLKKDGTVNGSITLRFDVTTLLPPGDCVDLQVRPYISQVCLGDDDGDGWWGAADIRVAGSINIHWICGASSGTKTIKFVTREIAELYKKKCTVEKFEKFLDMVQIRQDKDTSPTTTFDLLVVDNDENNSSDWIKVVVTLLKIPGADGVIKSIDCLRNKGEDTTGAGVGFDTLRKTTMYELGEAHCKKETAIIPPKPKQL